MKNYWNTHLSKKLGVKKEKSKVYAPAPPKTVPTDDCNNSALKCKRRSESMGEDKNENVQGDLNLASIYEGIMTDDFGIGSVFCFANGGLNLSTSSCFAESFQEYFMGL